MPPPTHAMEAWHDFYVLLGTASATMIGLLFVAASVGSGAFSADRRAPLRVFLSASVVNFSLILATSLIALVPLRHWMVLGGGILACGLFGLTHSLLAWRDTLRDGLIKAIDFEDRTWYLAMPILGYLCLAGSGIVAADGRGEARISLAVAMGVLLAAGIHNAWDITVWIITRRRE
jgi:hypothetical protein